jgi:hypothetical protein
MVGISELRRKVIGELVAAGFDLRGGQLVLPEGDSKVVARMLHASHRRATLLRAATFVREWEDSLLSRFASGSEVDPATIDPEIIPVESEADAALFRFASLHWTVPVSQGYGRRTRFMVRDRSNGKLIGVFALGDPVFNLRVRDNMIRWTQEQRRERLYNVFDSYVLGAVDPYRQLIGGKLVALCAVSNEVVLHLEQKYAGKTTIIQAKEKPSRPVLVTTTSALGRSSIYNRITYNGARVYNPVGYTEGFGHFQFSDDVFGELIDTVSSEETFRGNKYGEGPNWRMRTIRRALERLGLPGDLLRHGIRREVFLAPLSISWRAFLRGETNNARPYDYPLDKLADHFRNRWAIPRSVRQPEFREWQRDGMRLTSQLAQRSFQSPTSKENLLAAST